MNKKSYLRDYVQEELKPYQRANVILQGDIVEDAEMAVDQDYQTVLRIGYLNDMSRNGDLLPKYLESFDLVITNDGPFLPTNLIVNTLTKPA